MKIKIIQLIILTIVFISNFGFSEDLTFDLSPTNIIIYTSSSNALSHSITIKSVVDPNSGLEREELTNVWTITTNNTPVMISASSPDMKTLQLSQKPALGIYSIDVKLELQTTNSSHDVMASASTNITFKVFDAKFVSSQGHGLWWFNGADAQNYDESCDFSLTGLEADNKPTKWTITQGDNIITLSKNNVNTSEITTTQDNTIEVKSIGSSSSSNDVIVKITHDGKEIYQQKITVFTPTYEVQTKIKDEPRGNSLPGYDSFHYFYIADQFKKAIPDSIHLAEHRTATVREYIPNTNWKIKIGHFHVASSDEGGCIDCLSSPFPTLNWTPFPIPEKPGTVLSNEKVLYMSMEHYVGDKSAITDNTTGCKVLTSKYQYYIDHGRRLHP